MSRTLSLLYGSVAYLGFLGVFTYAMAFTGDFLVPRTINSGGTPAESLWSAIATNVLLLGLFGIQHTIMARPAFKRWWTRFVPRQIERSTFVLATNIVLALLFYFWRPIPTPVWTVDSEVGRWALWSLSGLGWAIVLVATFLIDHFDLFGLKQVTFYALGKPYPKPRFAVRSLYRWVRHPLMLGFLVAFWSTPVMTVGHLVFALTVTAYILVAVQIEERDLVAVHGEDYLAYRRRVPMLLPIGGKAEVVAPERPARAPAV